MVNGRKADFAAQFADATLRGPGVQDAVPTRELFPEIIGKSPAMLAALQMVCKVARSSSAVLILGESGTGKELIASAVHRLSTRAQYGFYAINCSAIPEELLEAELFGHEKGAFTGADRRRLGLFGSAHHGTIFLDEIGDMPARLQAKLLRVLQEKKYSPVGSNEIKESDVRIVAATNVDLDSAVRQQKFRLDLYYRLNVLPIHLPPLRERPGDVNCLLEYFVDQANHLHALSQPCWFDASAIDALSRYAWPGNVRQLQNLVERLVIAAGGGKISLADLPPEVRSERSIQGATVFEALPQTQAMSLPETGFDLTSHIEGIENFYIAEALRKTGNNKNQAAKLLGLNRTTLVERIKKRALDP